MQIDGAVVREQNVTFAIAIVKSHVVQNQTQANNTRESLSRIADFASLPIVLAAQDGGGRFTYQGRRDIVDFLASISPSRIPWRRYTVA